MPQSRARAAICSAPFEWPSSPGLPTRNLSCRPSFADTRSTASRIDSSPSVRFEGDRDTPVGPRYSPCTPRMTPAHSPVVASARAAAIEAGMMFLPASAARRSSASAAATAAPSRAAPGVQSRDLVLFHRRIDGQDRAIPRSQRRGLGLGPAVDADDNGFLALDPRQTFRIRC